MKADLFEFRDYRAYLLAVLGDKSQRRGMKSSAAKSIGCHTTVISQILSGKVQLNLEQADRFNVFLNHGEEESHYFFLLVQKERAGTRSLQSYFYKQIEQFIEGRLIIKKRIGATESISKEDEQKYYGSWQYAAIHVALSIPSLRSADALSRYFRLPVIQVNETLSFLLAAGLAVKSKGEVVIGPKHVHLGATSSHIGNHHRNWRLKALQSFDMGSKTDLHYSAAVTISRDDAVVIREKMIEHLKGLNKTIQNSKEEEVYAVSFDFFGL